MLPRGRAYGYPPGRNGPDVPIMPAFNGGVPSRNAAMPHPIAVDTMTSTLANATPDQQRMILGESLYPLVDQIEHENAAKVTGMLLEMDQTEVLHLLESPEALMAKVGEAMEVLKNSDGASGVTGVLAGMSLDDVIVA